MKVALVHDWLLGLGGAEKVLGALCELFEGPIYTLIKVESALSSFPNRSIYTSFLQYFPYVKSYYQNLLPLFPTAIRRFDLSEYDLIISSSHCVAKAVRKLPHQLHICYCHTPMRYTWDFQEFYLQGLNSLKKKIARPILSYLRNWDRNTNSVDHFIANSHYVSERIKKHYGREATVIYPPVNTHLFSQALQREEYYVTCSRLVPYKRVDLILSAFAKMGDKKLMVIGEGPQRNKLQAMASKNVEFVGQLSSRRVSEIVAKSKAFLFAAEEDFGIAVVEAQAAGVPVIAYGVGGVVETVIDRKTGLLFKEQTVTSLLKAIALFDDLQFNADDIQKHAQHFSKERFLNEISHFVANVS